MTHDRLLLDLIAPIQYFEIYFVQAVPVACLGTHRWQRALPSFGDALADRSNFCIMSWWRTIAMALSTPSMHDAALMHHDALSMTTGMMKPQACTRPTLIHH